MKEIKGFSQPGYICTVTGSEEGKESWSEKIRSNEGKVISFAVEVIY